MKLTDHWSHSESLTSTQYLKIKYEFNKQSGKIHRSKNVKKTKRKQAPGKIEEFCYKQVKSSFSFIKELRKEHKKCIKQGCIIHIHQNYHSWAYLWRLKPKMIGFFFCQSINWSKESIKFKLLTGSAEIWGPCSGGYHYIYDTGMIKFIYCY